MSSKRFGHIIIIAVLSTFLVIGSATARTIISYNTAYAAGGVNASSSATIPTSQIDPYTSTKILLQDGISALQQDNDTSKALTHLKLAYQQLSSIGENSSTVQPTKILLQDGISALQQDNDVSKTLVYMKLAYQQLSAPSNTASLPSSSITPNPAPLSSSSSASSSTNRIIVNNISPTQNRGIATASFRSPSQTSAPKKDAKSAQCDARCINLAQAAGISLARQNAKGGITMSLDKIKNIMCVHHTDQYCKVATDNYQTEYHFVATGLKPQPKLQDDPRHCTSTSTPTCGELGYEHGIFDAQHGIVNDQCISGHSKDYCGKYSEGVMKVQQDLKLKAIQASTSPAKTTGPMIPVTGTGVCNNPNNKVLCTSIPSGPTPSPISIATSDPPHCDKAGYPSCESLGEKAGEKARNVACPSGHSKEYCRGWNKTACDSEGCGGDYTCDNPNQPKGVAGCPNNKNSKDNLAQVKPTSSSDCIDNPAIGISCPHESDTSATPPSPPPSQQDCTKNPSDSSCNQPSNLSTLSAQSGNPNTALPGLIPTDNSNNPSSIDNNPTPVAPNTNTVDTCSQDPNADSCKTSPSSNTDTTTPPDTTSGTTPSLIGNNGAPIDNGGGTTDSKLLSLPPDNTVNNSPDNGVDTTTIQSSPPHDHHHHHHHDSVSSTDNSGGGTVNSAPSSDSSENSGDSGSSDSGGGSSDSGGGGGGDTGGGQQR
jgi:hypothetical protein